MPSPATPGRQRTSLRPRTGRDHRGEFRSTVSQAVPDTSVDLRVRPYDFQRQETLERSRLRRLDPILEVLTHRIGGSLTSRTRTPVRVEPGPVDQIRWEEYAELLPEPTFLTSTTVTPLGGRVVLHLPISLCLSVVEVRLGGTGGSDMAARSLTDIEQRLVGEIADATVAEIPSAFAPVIPLGLGPTTSVSSAVFLQVAKPGEYCAVVTLRVALGEAPAADASLCIPFTVLLPIVDALERLDMSDQPELDTGIVTQLRDRLGDCAVDAAVSFPPVTLASDELLALAPGDVIPLHHEQGLPLVFTIAGEPICHVVPTARGKHLACVVVDDGGASHAAVPGTVPHAAPAHPLEEK